MSWLRLAALATVFSATAAAAQSPDDLNRAAGALFEKGDFAGAARLLEVVLRLEPSAKAHKNLALCYAKIPDAEEKAVLHMQAYLRARPDAKDRAAAERLIADMDERHAKKGTWADIESVPPGAEVYLDDGAAPLGRTPLRARVPLGKHVLRLERASFETVRYAVRAQARRELRVAVALTPANRDGTILVAADVPGATVTIDGRPARVGPNPVRPGAHQVRVARAGYSPWEAEIRVPPGGVTEVVSRLVLAPPPVVKRPYRTWKWVAVGLAIAGAATVAIGYGRAVMDRNRANARDAQQYPSIEDFRTAWDKDRASADRNTGIARIGAGVMAAAAAASGVLFWLDSERRRRLLGVAPLPGGGMASLTLRY